jgi:hypothetical protein
MISPFQIVNNTAGRRCVILVATPVRTTQPSRLTNRARLFARSRNPDADTHSQVPTFDVPLYGLRPASINQHSLK